jgi:hypothetical protein
MKFSPFVLLLSLVMAGPVQAKAKKIDDYHWTGVDRVVAIGDLHGDYEQYLKVMASAGLINGKGKWTGGDTHLVQTGDITDRGPDSRKIIDHLVKLAKQARKKRGYIHMLIGNHEAMNVSGDLRYVSEGEFKAFTTRNSAALQQRQWESQLQWMRANILTFEEIDLVAYRAEWEQRVPLGWVEHRNAWSFSGEYGSWAKKNAVAVKLNDTIFLHGGISAKYCKLSLRSITEQAIAALEINDPTVETIINDSLGPLWYRGLAEEDETELFSQTLDNILERYGASRIVVGHTPTGGVVWPRFDQRVVANDTGIAAHYGSNTGILELTAEGATAIYGEQRIPLPVNNSGREGYLRAVIETNTDNARLKARLAKMLAPPAEDAGETGNGDADAQDGQESPVVTEPLPGICR